MPVVAVTAHVSPVQTKRHSRRFAPCTCFASYPTRPEQISPSQLSLSWPRSVAQLLHPATTWHLRRSYPRYSTPPRSPTPSASVFCVVLVLAGVADVAMAATLASTMALRSDAINEHSPAVLIAYSSSWHHSFRYLCPLHDDSTASRNDCLTWEPEHHESSTTELRFH